MSPTGAPREELEKEDVVEDSAGFGMSIGLFIFILASLL
jgi:hypothetical protein